MGVYERILSIRLLEKLKTDPEYAKVLGIELSAVMAPPGDREKKEETVIC